MCCNCNNCKSKPTEDRFEIDIPIYHCSIDVRLDGYENNKQDIKSKYNIEILEDDTKSSTGLMYDLLEEEGKIIIVIDDITTITDTAKLIGIISHESIHAAMYILDNAGIPINLQNDEVLAYLHQYILENIINKII